jgi:hypothetical protein
LLTEKRKVTLNGIYLMKKKGFKQRLNELPDLVKKTKPSKFYILLGGLFLLPGGSLLCAFALYLRYFKKKA